jgi:hypothetical protein
MQKQETETTTDPRIPVVKRASLTTPERLQYILLHPTEDYDRINVRLILDETNHYDELLPVEVVQGLIDPTVDDFFILIKGHQQIPNAKGHWLQTSFIREVILMNELPEKVVN